MDSINKFLLLISESGIPVSNAILFGSYAKGNENIDSDIDIAIVSSKFGRDNLKEMMFLRKLALKIDSQIEPIPFSTDDLNDPYSTLASEIKRYGIPLLK